MGLSRRGTKIIGFDSFLRPIRNVVNRVMSKKYVDDFRWRSYTGFDYEPQLQHLSDTGFNFLLTEDLIDSLRLDIELKVDNLHAPHIALYRMCLQAKPKRILEVGAGAGYHMINLSRLLPLVDICGVDLLHSQIQLGNRLFPEHSRILSKIEIVDFTKSSTIPIIESPFDIVYTQAVTMHLSYQKAIRMIMNMLAVSRKDVFLVEEFESSHDYNLLGIELSQQVPGWSFSMHPISNSTSGVLKFTRL